jgi:hypothetical protein
MGREIESGQVIEKIKGYPGGWVASLGAFDFSLFFSS